MLRLVNNQATVQGSLDSREVHAQGSSRRPSIMLAATQARAAMASPFESGRAAPTSILRAIMTTQMPQSRVSPSLEANLLLQCPVTLCLLLVHESHSRVSSKRVLLEVCCCFRQPPPAPPTL